MDFSLGLAFTAGLLATLNPCAIGMLPAYVALRTAGGPARALVGAISVHTLGLVAGFVGMFSLVALALALFGRGLLGASPFVSGVIGAALVALGVATFAGRQIHLPLPYVGLRGDAAGLGGHVVFGATYALASLGCALPVFLGFTAAALAQRH